MKKLQTMGRRQFLKGSAGGLAAAVAAPTIVPATVFGRPDRPAPSDRIVLGVIGTGGLGQSGHHLAGPLTAFKPFEVAALCDVDRHRLAGAARIVKRRTNRRVAGYKDFRHLLERRDIDAVVVVTPDHWHALISIAAMEAGKDVYCEKPLTLTIEEGKAMVKAARRYGTVFQTGSQQRSDGRFRKACELVRNGKIGKIHTVSARIGGSGDGPWQPVQTPPPELDWNFWLGPAPYEDYTPDRCHGNFRWYRDYSGGKMTDWGAHHNDIAQWGLGMDGSGPVKVAGQGVFPKNGPHDVPNKFKITYTYANGVKLICQSDGENGVKFEGEDGWIFVSRSRIAASDPDILNIKLGAKDVRLYNSPQHHRNWLDCIKSRKPCVCDVQIGHRSVSVCHLGNIAIRLGREVAWDPDKEVFVNDAEANLMLSRPMRAPWHL
ncbi:MAG: Gfo/Idh/MocA family protein [Planctomycetota bacterium]|jgi:predicted dehydrogenase